MQPQLGLPVAGLSPVCNFDSAGLSQRHWQSEALNRGAAKPRNPLPASDAHATSTLLVAGDARA